MLSSQNTFISGVLINLEIDEIMGAVSSKEEHEAACGTLYEIAKKGSSPNNPQFWIWAMQHAEKVKDAKVYGVGLNALRKKRYYTVKKDFFKPLLNHRNILKINKNDNIFNLNYGI